MKFSLLEVEQPKKLNILSKSKINFFEKNNDVSLFHFNQLDDDLFHVVFNISDEYQIGTKKLGSQINYSYSSLVNFFYLLNSKYVLIEYINKEYRDEVTKNITERTKTIIKPLFINNHIITKIYQSLEGTIKKLEYTNEDGELFDKDYVEKDHFYGIAENNRIDRITVLAEEEYISISQSGHVTVSNSDENYLIKFTKRILSSIEDIP